MQLVHEDGSLHIGAESLVECKCGKSINISREEPSKDIAIQIMWHITAGSRTKSFLNCRNCRRNRYDSIQMYIIMLIK
jgi:hypothetical protein